MKTIQSETQKRRLEKRLWSKIDKRGKSEDHCWPWTGAVKKTELGDYGLICITNPITKKEVNKRAHRVLIELLEGRDLDEKEQVCHTCHNTLCCNPNHLYIGDNTSNQRDRWKDQTDNKGERHGMVILNEKQVLEIRSKYQPRKYTYSRLAAEYGVSYYTIWAIVNRKSWGHLK